MFLGHTRIPSSKAVWERWYLGHSALLRGSDQRGDVGLRDESLPMRRVEAVCVQYLPQPRQKMYGIYCTVYGNVNVLVW